MPQTTDGAIKSTSRAYVVFDRGTGEIVHVHYAVTIARLQTMPCQSNEKPRRHALYACAGLPSRSECRRAFRRIRHRSIR